MIVYDLRSVWINIEIPQHLGFYLYVKFLGKSGLLYFDTTACFSNGSEFFLLELYPFSLK